MSHVADELVGSLLEVLSCLQQLGSPLSPQQCDRAEQLAELAAERAEAARGRLGGDLRALRGALAALGLQLEALSGPLAAALSAAASASSCSLVGSISQLYGACWQLAGQAQLADQQRQQLGRGLRMVTGAGLAVVSFLARSPPESLQAVPPERVASQLLKTFASTAAAAQPAVGFGMLLASTTMPVHEAVAFVDAMRILSGSEATRRGFNWNDVLAYNRCWCAVATAAGYQEALSAAPGLQAALLAAVASHLALLRSVLPTFCVRAPANVLALWQARSSAAAALTEGSWVPAAVQHACQHSSGAALILDLLLQAHLSPATGGSPAAAQAAAVTEARLDACWWLRQAAVVVAEAALACRSKGSPGSSSPAGSEARGGTACDINMQQLALMAVRLLPQAVVATRQLTAMAPPSAETAASESAGLLATGASHCVSEPPQADTRAASQICAAHDQASLLLAILKLALGASTPAFKQLNHYCAAALAGLQLLPLALRLQQAASAAQAMSDYGLTLTEHLMRLAHKRILKHGGKGICPATSDLLSHTHQWAARLVHAGGDAAQCSVLPLIGDSRQLLVLLMVCFNAAWDGLDIMARRPLDSVALAKRNRDMDALAAAQVEALIALGCRMSPQAIVEAAESQLGTRHASGTYLFVCGGLLQLLSFHPGVGARAEHVVDMAAAICRNLLQWQTAGRVPQMARFTFGRTAVDVMAAAVEGDASQGPAGMALPSLPAALFTSGLLGTLLQGAAEELHTTKEQIRIVESFLEATLCRLLSSAAAVLQHQIAVLHGAPDYTTSAGQAALPPELAARLADGQGRVAALLKHKRRWLLRNFAAAVQPAAAELAAALQQYWQLPRQRAAAEVDLATAASARACAYLRCSNLGAEGGPAAGEGVGSMKCSACRAVWYCGTACSHADWRHGVHRRTCKALAAARRGEKAAAAEAQP